MSISCRTIIRKIASNDFQLLSEFLTKNNTDEINRYFSPFPLTKETAYQISYLSNLDQYYLAAFDEKVIGLAMLRGWNEGYSIPSFGLLIDKDFQKMGVGKQMLKYTIKEARTLGCQKIRLTVYASNTPAIYLYKSAGFQEISRRPTCVLGEHDEKILMCKELVGSNL